MSTVLLVFSIKQLLQYHKVILTSIIIMIIGLSVNSQMTKVRTYSPKAIGSNYWSLRWISLRRLRLHRRHLHHCLLQVLHLQQV